MLRCKCNILYVITLNNYRNYAIYLLASLVYLALGNTCSEDDTFTEL